MDELLDSVRRDTKRVGQKDPIDHLTGKRITQRQAINAKCYDCNGMGELGTCDIESCSLYPYSPYGGKSPRGKRSGCMGENKGIVEGDANHERKA